VTEPNSVFDTGTVLDGRNTYFTRVAPVLDVDVETSYAADAASDIDISFESVLVTQNVGSDDGTVYWDERETLTTETVSGVEPGETATASFALNSSEVDATASEIESDLGASPGETETFVTTAVTVEGTINGESTSYARTIEMTLDHGGDTYTVSEPGLNRTRRNRPSRSPSSRATDLSVLRADRCCSWRGGLLGLAGWRTPAARSISRSRRPSGSTSYRDDRSEFAEWITAIRLPESVHNRPEAEASSLRDLVDFAIDNDTGVVEDPGTGAYHAVTDEFVYTYAPLRDARGRRR